MHGSKGGVMQIPCFVDQLLCSCHQVNCDLSVVRETSLATRSYIECIDETPRYDISLENIGYCDAGKSRDDCDCKLKEINASTRLNLLGSARIETLTFLSVKSRRPGVQHGGSKVHIPRTVGMIFERFPRPPKFGVCEDNRAIVTREERIFEAPRVGRRSCGERNHAAGRHNPIRSCRDFVENLETIRDPTTTH